MSWTWAEISEQWCFGGTIAANPDEIVAAFELVEARLGRDWINAKRPKPNEIVIPGTLCVDVLSLGRELNALGNAPGIEIVLAKIRAGDISARLELIAAHLCRGADRDVTVEFGVPVAVGKRIKVPDFRLRKAGEPWVWVEVSTPERSEAADDVLRVLTTFAPLLKSMSFGHGGEIFIRRQTAPGEVTLISQAFLRLLAQPTPARRDIEGLALLLYGHFEPGKYGAEDQGEPRVDGASEVRWRAIERWPTPERWGKLFEPEALKGSAALLRQLAKRSRRPVLTGFAVTEIGPKWDLKGHLGNRSHPYSGARRSPLRDRSDLPVHQ